MDIVIYTSPYCFSCYRAKEYLRSRNLVFKEIDISESREAAQEMVQKTGQKGVPVILIDGKPVMGFKPEEIDKYTSS